MTENNFDGSNVPTKRNSALGTTTTDDWPAGDSHVSEIDVIEICVVVGPHINIFTLDAKSTALHTSYGIVNIISGTNYCRVPTIWDA